MSQATHQLPDRRRALRFVAEVIAALVVASIVSAGVQMDRRQVADPASFERADRAHLVGRVRAELRRARPVVAAVVATGHDRRMATACRVDVDRAGADPVRHAAAQFFPLDMAMLGTPMLQPSVTGAICMTGLVWIVLAWRRSSVAQAFGVTTLACVAWQLMSTLLLADDTTLLSSHIAKVAEIVLWCACAFAVRPRRGRSAAVARR